MALIPDLPAASSVASTDVFIKDTGSATQKITGANLASEMFRLGGPFSVVNASINNGASASFTISGTPAMVLMIAFSAYSGGKGMYLINVTSGGAVTTATIANASGLTITSGSNSLTVANSAGAAVVLRMLVFSGTVS